MLKYKLDNLTNQGEQTIAYIHVVDSSDETKAIETVSMVYDKETFKSLLEEKTAKIKNNYEKKEAVRLEIEMTLGGMNK